MKFSSRLALTIIVTSLGIVPGLYAQSILIKNVDIETMTSDGRLDNTDVLIVDGNITRITENLPNTGARIIDGSGKRLTPGVFNAYTRLGVVEIDAIDQTNDSSAENARYTASHNVIDSLNPLYTAIPQNRIHGVTHALVAPRASDSVFAGIASIINLSGSMTNSIEKEAVGVVVNYNEYAQRTVGGSRAVALATIRSALSDAREFAQNKEKYLDGDGRELSVSFDDLEALIPIIERQQYLIVSVDRAIDILKILDLAQSFNIKLILKGVQEGWMVAPQIAQSNAPVIMDPIDNLPGHFETLGARLDNAALLDAAGVTLLFTGMGGKDTHTAYLVTQSAGNGVANGLPYQSALRALFSNPAMVFGLQNSGQIAVGQTADLVLWSGDPLELLREAEFVMINGQESPMASRSTRLRDRYFEALQ